MTPTRARRVSIRMSSSPGRASTLAPATLAVAMFPRGRRGRNPGDAAKERPDQAEVGGERAVAGVRDAEARLLRQDAFEIEPLRVDRAGEQLGLVVEHERRRVGEARSRS